MDPQFFQMALPQLLAGSWVTIKFTVLSAAIGMVIGLIVAIARISRNPILRAVSTAYVEFFRGTPLLVQIFIIAFGIGQWINVPDFLAGVIALSINSGAYTSEIFRAGIQSIERGQMEAARSLGMNYLQAMRYIILPQAIRRVLPPLANDFIAILKDSSLISVLGVRELTQMGVINRGRTFRGLETYNTVASLYLSMTLTLSLFVKFIERRLRTAH